MQEITFNNKNKPIVLKLLEPIEHNDSIIFNTDNDNYIVKKTRYQPEYIPGMPKKSYFENYSETPKFLQGVVRIYDIIENEEEGVMYYYIIMERLGYTLDDICITPSNVYTIVKKLIKNLQKIHAAGYTLLEIKPENIMISKNSPTVYFTDIDFVTKFDDIDTYTKKHKYIGSPLFSSIYQLLERPVYPVDSLISVIISGLYLFYGDSLWLDNSTIDPMIPIAYYQSKKIVEWYNEILTRINDSGMFEKRKNYISKNEFKKSWDILKSTNDKTFGLKYLLTYLYMIPRTSVNNFIDYDFMVHVCDYYISGKHMEDSGCQKKYMTFDTVANFNENVSKKIIENVIDDKVKSIQFNSSDAWSCKLSMNLVNGLINKLYVLKNYANAIDSKKIQELIDKAPKCKNRNNYLWNYLKSSDYITIASDVASYNNDAKDILFELTMIYDNFNK